MLNTPLEGTSWLVGDKCTYADLAFVVWNIQVPFDLKDAEAPFDIDEFPHYKKCMEAMQAKDRLKHVMSVLMDKEIESEGRV